MEKEYLNNEQRELVESIKETYSPNAASVKLLCVLGFILVAIIVGDVLTGGSYRDWIGASAIILFLTLAEYCKYRFSRAIEQVDDVSELLALYKRYEKVSAVVYSLVFISFLVRVFYDKYGDKPAFAIAMAVVVLLLVVCWFAGGFTDKNFRRLRKLVAQEKEKSEADV